MRRSRMGNDLSVSFARDDEEQRGSSTAGWPVTSAVTVKDGDVTAIVESLQLLGGKTRQVDVHARRIRGEAGGVDPIRA